MERGSYIQVASGDVLDPLRPDPDKIMIGDIATALGNQCRFTGHVRRFYSVAEHSVHVSRMVPPEHAKVALMHDSPEYIISDLSAPVKTGTDMGTLYRRIEDDIWAVIAEKFGLPAKIPDVVKDADANLREIERLQLIPRTQAGDELWAEWPADASMVPEHCWPQCWTPELAQTIFLERWREVQ
jgi:hypothetical protein